MSSKGRTELQISLSRAKNCEEVAGDVRFCVAPQKLHKNCEKLNFTIDFFRTFPNASKCIETHPDASQRIRTHPSRSGQVRASPKSSNNLRKLRKTCEFFAKISRKLSPRTSIYLINFNYFLTAKWTQFKISSTRRSVSSSGSI